jgi:(S)-sulfolactate dehydrogenase
VRILVTEFMDERAVGRLSARHDVLHDPKLVDEPQRLRAQAAAADALIAAHSAARRWTFSGTSRCRHRPISSIAAT